MLQCVCVVYSAYTFMYISECVAAVLVWHARIVASQQCRHASMLWCVVAFVS